MNLREKIAKIIADCLLGLNLHPDTPERIADNILSLPIESLEVEEKCSHFRPIEAMLRLQENMTVMPHLTREQMEEKFKNCVLCQGTGTIHRPATLEDVNMVNMVERLLNLYRDSKISEITMKTLRAYLDIILTARTGGRFVIR